MLAVLTAESAVLVTAAVLKNPPPVLDSTFALPIAPTTCTWTPDNGTLIVAHKNTLLRCSALSSNIIFTLPDASDPISHMVYLEKGATVLCSSSTTIYAIHKLTTTAEHVQSIQTHQTPIVGLSLSNDGTLLASASNDAVHIHNIAKSTPVHTVLRALPLKRETVSTCEFHPHFRTRLLIGIGRQLVLYDTSRPSGPIRTYSTEEVETEMISCSPFSKTLVAVANKRGNVALIDLEKERRYVYAFPRLTQPLTTFPASWH
jgi:protein NEDD1